MTSIILVEDHSLVIEGLRNFIAAEDGYTCLAACNTGEQLMQTLTTTRPDVILMDINLPDVLGIDLCKQVKAKYPGIYVIALSINNQPGVIRKMILAGASGYVLKDAGKAELFEAIRIVTKGKTFYGRSVSEALRKPEQPAGLPPLTRREKEVLELIADGYTNQQIADALFVDVTTIDFHRKNMLSKYKVKNTAELVKVTVSNKLI